MIKGLVNIIKNLRNSGIASYVEVAKNIAIELDLETDFPEKRKTKKKRKIALRIFLTLPVTVASCERSFSKLKIIKNYLRSTLGQERLTNLGILSIEFETSNSISYDDIIDDFAAAKARKIKF